MREVEEVTHHSGQTILVLRASQTVQTYKVYTLAHIYFLIIVFLVFLRYLIYRTVCFFMYHVIWPAFNMCSFEIYLISYLLIENTFDSLDSVV